MENSYCLRCSRELEGGNKSVAVYMFSQTVGIKPRQKSSAQRINFCPQCSVSLAMGPPPEGALNLAAWQMIRDLVGSDPAPDGSGLGESEWCGGLTAGERFACRPAPRGCRGARHRAADISSFNRADRQWLPESPA